MGGDDEMWRDFESADLADFMRSLFVVAPRPELTLPDDLEFSLEQRAFIASLMSHVAEELTYELSHKWTKHIIDILVAGGWQVPGDVEPAAGI